MILLTSYYSNIDGGVIAIDASKISNKAKEKEQTFKLNNKEFIYFNVYNDNKEFVILPGGYIKCKTRTQFGMRFKYSSLVDDYISVILLDSNSNIVDSKMYSEKTGIFDGKQTYNIIPQGVYITFGFFYSVLSKTLFTLA